MKALSCTKPTVILVALAVSFTMSPDSAYAAKFTCNNVDCLVSAINASNANSETNLILLQAGAYTPSASLSISGNVTIQGPSEGQAILAGVKLNVTQTGSLTIDRLNFTAAAGVNGSTSLSNDGVVNITGSAFTKMGGPSSPFSNNDGTLNINSSIFADNGQDGPVLFVGGGTVRITGSLFTRNTGFHYAAALLVAGGFVSISHSSFEHGGADGAGAIWVAEGFLRFNPPPAIVVISESEFTDNGGTTATIVNSKGTIIVSNSTIARNRGFAFIGGQGIYTGIANSGTLLLVNSTITGNTKQCCVPPLLPGAALVSGPTAITRVQNTVVALNGTSGAGEDCEGPIKSLGNNLIGNPNTCPVQPSDLTGDPGLGPFTDNDGIPGHGHYPLLPSSRAINAGNAAACPLEDQLGRSREGHCDMGSVTFTGRPPER